MSHRNEWVKSYKSPETGSGVLGCGAQSPAPVSSPSPECFPADIPGHFFQSSEDLLDQEPLADLELSGRCDSFADPFAAAALPAVNRNRKASVLLLLFA